MPRIETVLQVFLASPNDLAPERDALGQVVAELNSLWARKLGVRLDLIRWETHAFPALGDDAQDVINQQVPEDFDLFVGLMWARFGSPTGRAGSGTQEEFERALARYRADPTAVQLMIYFKDAPKQPSEIDPEQLLTVQAFRERVRNEGGLHWSFIDTEDFAQNVRIHLTRFVQAWLARQPSRGSLEHVSAESALVGLSPATNGEKEELGFLDLVESATETLQALTATQERMTAITNDLRANLVRRAAEIEDAKKSLAVSPATGKRVVNRIADDMEQFVRLMQVEATGFSQGLDEVIGATGTIASLALDFGPNSPAVNALPTLADQVENFGRILGNNGRITASLRETVASSPRITTAYNRAKRRTVDILGRVAQTLSSASDTCLQVAEGIRALLPKGDPDASGDPATM